MGPYLCSFARIANFTGEFEEIELGNGVSIRRREFVKNFFGKKLIGGDCWSDDRIEDYAKEQGEGRSISLNAYLPQDDARFIGFDFLVPWQNSEFFLEIQDINKPLQEDHERLIFLAHMCLALISDSCSNPAPTLTIFSVPTTWSLQLSINSKLRQKFNNRSDPFVMTGEKIDTFRQIFGNLLFNRTSETEIAVDRFFSGSLRWDNGDAINDYVIGLEALFSIGQNTEISYRIGIQAASLLEHSGKDREIIFELIRKAYGIRSKLLHGAKRMERYQLDGFSRSDKKETYSNSELEQTREALARVVGRCCKIRLTIFGSSNHREFMANVEASVFR